MSAASDAPSVHSEGLRDRVLWLVKTSLTRFGLAGRARALISHATRPTYSRTLRLVPNREELPFVLSARRLLGSGAEVGVAKGIFSAHLLENWDGALLTSIDPWLEMPPDEYVDTCNMGQESMEEMYEEASARLSKFGARSRIDRRTGTDAARDIPLGSLDFVYIDALHNYGGVMQDLQDWFPRVRPGGLLAGHDYNDGDYAEGIHEVRRAVDTFFGAKGLPVFRTRTDVPSISWLVEVPQA